MLLLTIQQVLKFIVSQGSVIGPHKCYLYYKPVSPVQGSSDYLCYADDTQVYRGVMPKEMSVDALTKPELYLAHIAAWISANMFMLNKENILIPKYQLKVQDQIQLQDVEIRPCSTFHQQLRHVLNTSLTMERLVLASACYLYICNTGHMRWYLR